MAIVINGNREKKQSLFLPSMSTSPLAGNYSPSGIAALASLFSNIPQLTPAQRRAAARAILRQSASLEDFNETCRNPGGLDHKFLELHGRGGSKGREAQEIQQVQNETLRDLLDTVQFSIYFFFIA